MGSRANYALFLYMTRHRVKAVINADRLAKALITVLDYYLAMTKVRLALASNPRVPASHLSLASSHPPIAQGTPIMQVTAYGSVGFSSKACCHVRVVIAGSIAIRYARAIWRLSDGC